MEKITIYKNYNQYNFTQLTLKVNYTRKEFALYPGMSGPHGCDKKVSKKYIKEYAEYLTEAGFKEVKGY